ncbi:MAG TPA: hypothetical protein DEQ20_02405 [Desulfobulbaceae bacterium]|nr:MAG: hypothetical protein A2520_03635 [Deltaproteobacteria bacterium RIFOXYD12_FULL_53_23]HCC53765.1 hypothetical protein [Desulfobulbaceae bacterium]
MTSLIVSKPFAQTHINQGNHSLAARVGRSALDTSSRQEITDRVSIGGERPVAQAETPQQAQAKELRVYYETMTSPGGYPGWARRGYNYDLARIKRNTPYDWATVSPQEQKEQIERINLTIDRQEQCVARLQEQLDRILASDTFLEEKNYARQAMNENIKFLQGKIKKYQEARDRVLHPDRQTKPVFKRV